MPLYEYRCHGCGKTIEVLQKFSDEPLTTHDGCGGEMEKLISASAFHLKGSGWYVTDYAKSNGETRAASEKKSEEKEKKADAKPADGGSTSTASPAPVSSSSESKAESKPAATESKPATPAGDSKA